jgi:glucosamine-6-phosphate deaminase
VPRKAMTMGIRSIMKARKILVVVAGADKAEAVYQSFAGPVTPQVPASILQLHADVTVVGDKAAMSKLIEAGIVK